MPPLITGFSAISAANLAAPSFECLRTKTSEFASTTLTVSASDSPFSIEVVFVSLNPTEFHRSMPSRIQNSGEFWYSVQRTLFPKFVPRPARPFRGTSFRRVCPQLKTIVPVIAAGNPSSTKRRAYRKDLAIAALPTFPRFLREQFQLRILKVSESVHESAKRDLLLHLFDLPLQS